MKKRKLGIVGVVTAALCASLFAGTAFAAGISSSTDLNANWDVPTTPMTNTVWKDADGNVVPEGTEGATQYKVLTTWAEAWSTSGADYLGVSNSAYYGNGGNGNALITSYVIAQKDTTAGVWATSANISPNAYNWNSYYNLYAANHNAGQPAIGGTTLELSDWTAMVSSANNGADWDTASGVWCGFKYRPDVVVTNNNLSSSAAAAYIGQIHEGHYSATATSEGGIYYPDPDSSNNYDSSYYVWGDENYDPTIMAYNNNSPYTFVVSAYQLAELSQDVIEATKDYPGLNDNEIATWQTVQKMPRSNRYTDSVTDCAVNIEMLAKGSVYYTLSQINQGNVDRKKVAYVTQTPADEDTASESLPEGETIVAVYDYTENIGTGPMDGRTSWTSLTVDQLGADQSLEVQTAKTGGSAVGEGSDDSTTTYVLYYADADAIASCDVVYCSPNVTFTQTQWQEWVYNYATTTENKNRSTEISYLTTWPVVTNGSNYTFEKFIYGAFGMDFLYPELFPSMELSCYWCDACYHLTSASITSAMSWIYSTASLPAGATLSDISATYNRNNLLKKFAEGLDYFNNNKTTDPTMSRVLSNTAIDGTTTFHYSDQRPGTEEDLPYVFNGFEPTDYWQDAEFTFVDKEALEVAIANAGTINTADYTDETVAVFEEALMQAEAVNANADATQDEVDAATNALLSAIAGLNTESSGGETGVNKAALEATINVAGMLNTSNYTKDSREALESAIASAEAVNNNANATQDEVNAAVQALNEAIAGLETQFSDVTDSSEWYYEAVYNLVKIGAITGYENGSFGVGDTMTRAQLVTIMWRYCEPEEYAAYDEPNAKNETGFSDVENGQYYTGAINWAINNGVVTGYNDTTFGTNDSVTFDQMITIFARYALGFDGAANFDTSALNNGNFTDKDAVEDFACGSMAWAIYNGLVTGNQNSDGTWTLSPLENVARERAATVLWRAIEGGQI